jgi:hypothetical protein
MKKSTFIEQKNKKITIISLVQDDRKLLNDGGETPKSQGRGVRFPDVKSPLYLTEDLPGDQLPHVLWCWHVDLLSQK